MPTLARWYVKTALCYLALGALLGAIILWNKGAPIPGAWGMLAPHIALVTWGWLLLLTLGVAYWILPRWGPGASPRLASGRRLPLPERGVVAGGPGAVAIRDVAERPGRRAAGARLPRLRPARLAQGQEIGLRAIARPPVIRYRSDAGSQRRLASCDTPCARPSASLR